MSAVSSRTSRSANASTSIPWIPSVPLMRARPSLASSSIGSRSSAASAAAAEMSAPPTSTLPSPSRARAAWAKGARSPEAPSDPYSCTAGVIPALSIATIRSTTSGRIPEYPMARVRARSSIMARTTSRSTRGPMPAAWERIRLRCSSRRRSSGMNFRARAPNPVEMPYAGSPALARSSTTWRECSIASLASALIATDAPWRATATTSDRVSRVPVSSMLLIGGALPLRASPASLPRRRAATKTNGLRSHYPPSEPTSGTWLPPTQSCASSGAPNQ